MAEATGRSVAPARTPRPFRARIIAGLPIAIAAALGAYGILLCLAEPLLWLKARPRPADAIVVLGGDGPRRAARAAELYRAGMAPLVFVTGDGDCLSIHDAIVGAGVPASAITVECRSSNTWENAKYMKPLLARAGVGTGLIVTSWFHTRRALACFHANSPGIEWTPAATLPDATLPALAASWGGLVILQEYIKTGWYALRYGLVPARLPEQL